MLQKIKNLFLNEKLILVIILLNLVVVFAQESGFNNSSLFQCLDITITIVFLIEMIVKQNVFGFCSYWKNKWNCFDGVLILISLPSLLEPFMATNLGNFNIVLILRTFRIFKFFRIVKFFPHIENIAHGLKIAIKDSYGVFAGFTIIIFIVALVNCALFKMAAPEFFATPLDSIYSVFRLFTVEGWYEIPNTIADYYNGNQVIANIVKLYFSILLLGGGIIGLSFVNSIFVDAMVSDNNDDLNAEVKKLHEKIDALTEKINDLSKKNKEED